MSNDLTILDETKPDGATETVSVLDDYERETRQALKDWASIEHDLMGRHKFPHGTRAQRPVIFPSDGALYFNEQDRRIEKYDGTLSKWLFSIMDIARSIVTTKGDLFVLQQFTPTGGATFNITSGTRIVTATGSLFTSELRPGDSVTLDPTGTPQTFIVEGITSDTEFITTVVAGSSITNKDARALTVVRLPAGADGQGIVADSTAAAGVAYKHQRSNGYREFGFKYGVGATGLNTNNDVCLFRRLLIGGTLAMEMEIGGSVYRSTVDVTLNLPANLPAAVVLSGGATFNTTAASPTVTATGSAFLTELKQGDTVIVDPGGSPVKLTVKTVDSNTQFTALQNASGTLNNKTAQRGGNTSVARVPDALYFVYVPPADQFAGAYLDTATPVNGYHPRNTTDRWAGPILYNTSGNVLETPPEPNPTVPTVSSEAWMWQDGIQEICLVGSNAGSYTTTSNGTFVAVDDTVFKRPFFIPAGVNVEVEMRMALQNSIAGNQTQVKMAQSASGPAFGQLSSTGGTVIASGMSRGFIQDRVSPNGGREGLNYYSLWFQTVGAGTATISNGTTELSTAAGGQGFGYPVIIIRFRTP